MSQSVKAIKNRIKSVANTQKVTNAMQMVSMAKLNRVNKILYAIRPYALKLEGILNNLVSMDLEISHPLLEKKVPAVKKLLCIVTSDNGLCGLYNTSVLRVAQDFISSNGKENVSVVVVGKRGYNFLKARGVSICSSYIGLNGKYNYEIVDKITRELTDIFLERKADEVWCAHTHFQTAAIHHASLEKILPLEPRRVAVKEYIIEPQGGLLLKEIVLQSIIVKMRRIIAEGFTAEHASRLLAMKLATDNAKTLFGQLTLARNKIRQASITQEIMEIISSVEALKG